ncbi:MAG TPA: MFS transporter [Actinocrinis sp.]|nr:MFS transporter [Actinocrinis sp.]
MRKVVTGAVVFGAAEIAAALAPDYPVFLALLVPTGFALMTTNAAVSGYVQVEVDEAMRGRVMAVYTVIATGGTPIGGPVIGWVSQHAGVRWGLGVGASVSIAAWLARRLAQTPGDPALVTEPVHEPAPPPHCRRRWNRCLINWRAPRSGRGRMRTG